MASAALPASAFAHLQSNAHAIMELQIALCEIPAPGGGEAARAEAVAHWLRSAGCTVEQDAAGNVIGHRAATEAGGAIVLSAHLDTVFGADQAVSVARPGEASPYQPDVTVPEREWHAPGIADDAAGLAGMIAVAQALAAAEIRTRRALVFVGTVGEEGRGDLRGARHYFAAAAPGAVGAFITLDHPSPPVIVTSGVGSRRLGVAYHGPGGHAWGDAGRYNPALAMAEAAQRLARLDLPGASGTTINVGVMQAGTAVNAIPWQAWMEVDLRSQDNGILDALDAQVRAACERGHRVEFKRRPGEGARVQIDVIGDRPGGETPVDAPLVRAAVVALEAEGFAPQLSASSTDANAAMAAGVPAIALGWGGRTGNQHSVRESFSPQGRERSLAAVLRLLLDLAGVD